MKTNRTVFWALAGISFYPLLHLGRRGGVLGILIVFGAFWWAMGRLRAMTREAFVKVPLVSFQVMGILNVITGIALIYSAQPK